ncbi:MAG: DUF4203 domain-containing protein [Candidatus Sumerlaeia bacterium]|nr:DUF4203 domain-containing protein [Candidatus Sumerlaeia bacterium]
MLPREVTVMLEIPENLQSAVEPIPLAVGIVFLLLGWLLYWGSVHLLGALLIGGLGLVLAESLTLLFPDIEPLYVLLMRASGVIIGVAAGLLIARLVHQVAFFIFGWLVGAIVFFKGCLAIGRHLEFEVNDLVLAFGTPVAGLILGIIAVRADRWLSIIATSLLGAILVTAGVNDWNAPILIPVLCALGILLQGMICTRGERRKKKD